MILLKQEWVLQKNKETTMCLSSDLVIMVVDANEDTDPAESEIAVGNQIQFTENGKPVLASVINRQGDVVELQDGNKVFRKTADELKEQIKKPDAINRGDEIPLQVNGELFVGKVTELPNADGKYTIHIASHPGQKTSIGQRKKSITLD